MSNDHQVFVDDTGKRKIAFNAITWTAGLAITAFTVLLLVSLTSSPTTNDSQDINYRATVPSSTTAQAVLPHQKRAASTSSEPSTTQPDTTQSTTQTTAAETTATTATNQITQTSATNTNATATPATTTNKPASSTTKTTPEQATGPQNTSKGRNNKTPPGLNKKPK